MEIVTHKDVVIPVRDAELQGELTIPEGSHAIIIFSHGSGSSRKSIRNQEVASYLHERNFGTLLFDLLTEMEDRNYANRFDIELMTKRLVDVTRWIQSLPVSKNCRFGYFGASTGAASALRASISFPEIAAIVSRGGRPDLVMENLQEVRASTLLIVGSHDHIVLDYNREAYARLKAVKKLEIVAGASHLFEEPGAMNKVCKLAADWFENYILPVSPPEN